MTRPRHEGRPYAKKVELCLHPSSRSVTIVLDGMAGKPLDSKQAVLNRLNQLSLNHRVRHRDFARMSLRVLQARNLCDTKREAAHARARAAHQPSNPHAAALLDDLPRDYGPSGQRPPQHRGNGGKHADGRTRFVAAAGLLPDEQRGRDHRAHGPQR